MIAQRSPLRSQELLELLPRLVALGGARRARIGAELLGPRLQQVEELAHLALERRVGGVGLEDGVRLHLHTVEGQAGGHLGTGTSGVGWGWRPTVAVRQGGPGAWRLHAGGAVGERRPVCR